MIEKLLSWVTPYNCRSCGHQGQILCDVCKYDITDEGFGYCLLCGNIADDICAECAKPWLIGGRTLGCRQETLEHLGNQAKFERSREAARSLADLLDAALPHFPPGSIVTSVPTHPAHVRQRGYDCVRYVARTLAQRRQLPYQMLVDRRLATEQRGHDAHTRALQAAQSYSVTAKIAAPPLIVLIDDVITTGSTLRAVSQKLYAAYEAPVYVAAAMRQPKDKPNSAP
jgi:predicted amidophosphoribosyltransferase